jgi:hypothetical protein
MSKSEPSMDKSTEVRESSDPGSNDLGPGFRPGHPLLLLIAAVLLLLTLVFMMAGEPELPSEAENNGTTGSPIAPAL